MTIATEERPMADQRPGRRRSETPEELAERRERRFRERRRRLQADPCTDPRLLTWYLDRALWSLKDIAREADIGGHRIALLRAGVKMIDGQPVPVRRYPHPSVFIDPDYWDNPRSPRYEAGRVRQFLEQRGNHHLDLDTGKLKRVRSRVGRPRAIRNTLSKPHEPGAPRKPSRRKVPQQRTDET